MVVVENPVENIPPEDVSAKVKPETVPLKPFTVEILNLIKDAQQQHGLKHGDYQRYRGYCSRRIGRLRKVLKLPQGDRRHFKKRDVTEAHVMNIRSDERFLHVPLILSERCWAYAMQLRQEANTEPRKKFHLIQKLRKACIYALQLEELCKQDRCDARTKLEAQAYAAWIQGTLQFELQLWQKAAENLKKAQVIYEKVAGTLPEEMQTAYRQRAEEIAPSLRYCAYNIGDDKAVDLLELRSQGVLENFDALVSQSKEKVADVLYEVKWFDLIIPVRIEKIRLFLVSIEGLDESLMNAEDNQGRIKILENLFIDLRDVISLARDISRADKTTSAAKQVKEYQSLLSYLLSVRIERTSQRNLLLIAQTRKPQDCVRLLDINVQQTNEMSQNETIKNDVSVKDYYDSQIAAYKALRYYYLGKSQAAQKRWKEAAVLFDRASRSVKNLKKDLDNNGYLDERDFACLSLRATIIEGKGEFSYNRLHENQHIMMSLWEEIAELADFNKDLLQDGRISVEEFKQAVQQCCQGRRYEDFPQAMKLFIDSSFKMVDLNDDGVIAADEYRFNCITKFPIDDVEVVDEAFNNMLNDDDRRRGGITLSRYQELYAEFLGNPEETPAMYLFGPLSEFFYSDDFVHLDNV